MTKFSTSFEHETGSQTMRDVWFSLVGLTLLMFVFYILVLFWRQSEWLIILCSLVVELLFLLPVLILLYKRKLTWRDIGFRKFAGRFIVWGLGLALGIYFVTWLMNIAVSQFKFDAHTTETAQFLLKFQSPYWLVLVNIIVAPIVEEIFFRGYVFKRMLQQWEWQEAALTSALLFALFHILDSNAFLPAFLMGFALSFLYQKSASIWPGIVAHSFINLLVLAMPWILAALL